MNYKKIYILLTVSLIIVWLATSCKKESVVIPYNPIVDLDYYPMEIGKYIDYDVEYIFWNDFNHTIDTSYYMLRELTESVIVNYSGDSIYRIERTSKVFPDSAWDNVRIWYSGFEENYAYKVEENIKYVKLIVPVKLNSKWDGNILNDLNSKKYTYVSVDQAMQFNNLSFPKCTKILQEDFETLINKDYEEEIYARHVGLVYKKQVHINKTYNQITQRFEITSGYSLQLTIKNYGTL